MTELERAHLTEIVLMARARGLTDAEIATLLRAEADTLAAAQSDKTEDKANG